jgi:hypothetical protein
MSFPNQISATFNQPVTLGVGTLKVYKDNVLFITFTQADIVLVGNTFTIDVTNLFPDLGNYYIIISEGLFKGIGCSDFSIKNTTDWTFKIGIAQYNKPSYSQQYS